MSTYFDNLTKEEIEKLEEAFVLVALVVAGSDGQVGLNEIEEGQHTLKVRGYEANNLFHQFYDRIHADFKVKVKSYIDEYGYGKAAFERYSAMLHNINPILDKLPHNIARHFYKDMISFAHRIANAEGGVLGFNKVSPDEKEVYNLPMIRKISPTDEEKEEIL